MAVALPFPRPGPREPAPVTIAILPASRPLMSRRLLPLRGCAATACHTIEPDEGLPHEVTHVRSRSEEHTSELQSQSNLVCRLLLEKKKKKKKQNTLDQCNL